MWGFGLAVYRGVRVRNTVSLFFLRSLPTATRDRCAMGKDETVAFGLTPMIMALAVALREYVWVFVSFAFFAIFVLVCPTAKNKTVAN